MVRAATAAAADVAVTASVAMDAEAKGVVTDAAVTESRVVIAQRQAKASRAAKAHASATASNVAATGKSVASGPIAVSVKSVGKVAAKAVASAKASVSAVTASSACPPRTLWPTFNPAWTVQVPSSARIVPRAANSVASVGTGVASAANEGGAAATAARASRPPLAKVPRLPHWQALQHPSAWCPTAAASRLQQPTPCSNRTPTRTCGLQRDRKAKSDVNAARATVTDATAANGAIASRVKTLHRLHLQQRVRNPPLKRRRRVASVCATPPAS